MTATEEKRNGRGTHFNKYLVGNYFFHLIQNSFVVFLSHIENTQAKNLILSVHLAQSARSIDNVQ